MNEQDDLNDLDNSDSQLDFLKFDKSILFIYIKRRIIFVFLIGLLSGLIAFFLSKLMIKDKWEVKASLLRHEKNISRRNDIPYLYQQFNVYTIMETIRVRENIQKIIDKLQLETTAEKLAQSISVSKNKSNIIHIFVNHKDKEIAVKVANELIGEFMEYYSKIQNSAAKKVYLYYKNRKAEIIKKINELKEKERKYLKKFGIISLDKEIRSKYEQVEKVELDYIKVEANISDLEAQVKEMSKKIELLPDEVKIYSTKILNDYVELNLLKQKYQKMKEKYMPLNPKVIKIKEEINELEAKIKGNKSPNFNTDKITFGNNQLKYSLIIDKVRMENQLAADRVKLKDFSKAIKRIKERLDFLAKIERVYYEIEREIKLNQEILLKIENRIAEARIAMEANVGDFEFIEPATIPKYPLNAKRKIIGISGVILGGGISLVIFLVMEILNFKVKSLFDLKQVVHCSNACILSEKNRYYTTLFYSDLQFCFNKLVKYLFKSQDKSLPYLVTVGSFESNVGKSFVSNHITDLLHSSNKKVLHIKNKYEINFSSKGSKEDFKVSKKVSSLNEYLYNKNNKDLKDIEIKRFMKYDEISFTFNMDTYKVWLAEEKIIELLKEMKKYDVVIWELFEFYHNRQLFKNLTLASNVTLLVSEFRKSDRVNFKEMYEFLTENNSKERMISIINKVPYTYYKNYS